MKYTTAHRSLFSRLVCLWLAGSILLGSSGFAVSEHWCILSGKKIETRLMPKDCQKAYREQVSSARQSPVREYSKTPCCKEVVRYEHLKTEQTNPVHSVPFNPVVSDFLLPIDLTRLLALLLPENLQACAPTLVDDPIVHSGRFRLISHCNWLI